MREAGETSGHTPTADEDFFVYRDYLYFEQEKQCLIVNANNTHYVKFPPMFAIRAYAKGTGRRRFVFVTYKTTSSNKLFLHCIRHAQM